MLRYCGWCGQFQGTIPGKGHQIRKDVCEVDTTTICPACREKHLRDAAQEGVATSRPERS